MYPLERILDEKRTLRCRAAVAYSQWGQLVPYNLLAVIIPLFPFLSTKVLDGIVVAPSAGKSRNDAHLFRV